MGRMVKIRYAKGETGWAEEMGNGTYRIDNIPLTDRLNVDDVVRCRLKLQLARGRASITLAFAAYNVHWLLQLARGRGSITLRANDYPPYWRLQLARGQGSITLLSRAAVSP